MPLPYDRPSDAAKRHSAALTDGPDRAGARAMLKAVGFTDEDLAKPIIGVATTWIETMPCNLNQRRLAAVGEGGHQGRGRHTHGVQHHRGQRWRGHGHRGHEGQPHQPRGRGRLHRVGGARPPLRRARHPLRLRQDQPRCGHGRGPARHPQRDPLQRHHLPGHVQGRSPGRRQRLRGHRRLQRGQDERGGALRHRRGGLSRGGRLRWPVHGQHHEHVPRVHGPLPCRAQRHPGGGREEGRGRPSLR